MKELKRNIEDWKRKVEPGIKAISEILYGGDPHVAEEFYLNSMESIAETIENIHSKTSRMNMRW
jgi:hypothetical protein